MRAPLLLPLVLAIATQLASAQTVSVSGTIEPLAAPPVCAPQATHRVKDTTVNLFSTTLDLSTVTAVPQVFTGAGVAGTCPLIDVAAVAPAPYQLFPCNTTALGCPFTIDQCPSPTDGVFVIASSLQTSYLPLAGTGGTILINPASAITVAIGPQTAVCQSLPVTIVGPGGLVGLVLNLQAVSVDAQGNLSFSTLAVIEIEHPSAGCTSFVCY